MKTNKFILGQKVRIEDCCEKDMIGKIGYVIEVGDNFCGVEFDEFVNGHDCNGHGTYGCCFYVPKFNLELVKEESSKLQASYKQVNFGKFKNSEELYKAYLSLEKEFTKRNQAYKKLAAEKDRAVMTKKELLALKAVVYGCNTNRKCGNGGIFVVYEDVEKKNLNIKEEIPFVEALEIMFNFIETQEKE